MREDGVKFRYVFEVRANAETPFAGHQWQGVDAPGEYLLGPDATLSWAAHTPAPWKLYARVTLSAEGIAPATKVRFVIERGLLTKLRAGDLIYVCEVSSRVSLSILRDNNLFAAAGACRALSPIPLGDDVSVRFPASHSEAEIHIPDGGAFRVGPRHDFPEHPTESTAGGMTIIWYRGRPAMGPYDVLLRSGLQDCESWLSIERKKVCPETAAHTSAELLENEPPEIIWR